MEKSEHKMKRNETKQKMNNQTFWKTNSLVIVYWYEKIETILNDVKRSMNIIKLK